MKEQMVKFLINGRTYEISIEPSMTLLEVLRDKLGLTGTKLSCGVGSCGVCTVLVDGKAINSCLTLAITVKGRSIMTIEGLVKGAALHPIQKAFIDHGAIQCGFCTPGMIMSAKALLDKSPSPTRREIEKAMEGNLCRCTGYVKISNAISAAAEAMKKGEKPHE
jgi:carbon-monoxide dehydrogenase small subunit